MSAFDHLKIISAGAGSGKTFRLTSEMVSLLEKGVRPSGIIATTFTNKAAAELQERVRLRLLQNGMPEKADELTNALIGTVHGLGVKLLKRFAYEAGVSPEVSIIADEDQQLLFNQSLATVLSENKVIQIEQLCERLGLSDNEYFDWRREVKVLTDVARSNDFSSDLLEESKNNSIASMKEFLGTPSSDSPDQIKQDLERLLVQSIQSIQTSEDGTKATANVLATLKSYQRELTLRAFLKWPQWAKLSKLKPGAKSKESVQDIIEFAGACSQHPELQEDVSKFIHLIFDTAIEALEEFDQYKKQRGLIDYIDMEVRIKNLLDNKQVQEILKEELDLLMVDEFQDTSPIQLEIFLKLSQFAKYSVWVGDPKQSIYGFRGADPKIMQAIIDQTGGIKAEDIQEYSWRSREDIVAATNAMFTKAFPHIPQEQLRLKAKRQKIARPNSVNKQNESIEMTNALIHWSFKFETESKNKRLPGKPWHENCIAHALREFLETPPIILPKEEKKERPARAGDIAILCRSNKDCLAMAEALYQAGFKVSISKTGLLQTGEAQLILACLKLILNPNDALSTAEILKLAVGQPLETIIESRLDYLENEAAKKRWAENNRYIQKLNKLREDVIELSTTEILDLVLTELDLRRIIISWGNAPKRLDNIDIIRQLSNQYEENCNRLHAPSSLGGFLLYLNELEYNDNDKQGSGKGPQAVEVMTYHKSKGLEWPIVICHNLDKGLRADVWGTDIVNYTNGIDLNNILGNRWIRYWVNPFGFQYKNTALYHRISESEIQKQKEDQAQQEEARLLYVGITRARDYLIFTSTPKLTKWLNRVWHNGKEDYPTLDPDHQESPWIWEGEILPIDTSIFSFDKTFESFLPPEKDLSFLEPPAGQLPQPPQYIDLRKESIRNEYKLELSPIFSYGAIPPVKIPEDHYLAAKGLKAFLTAFHSHYPDTILLKMAQDLIQNHELEDSLEPPEIIKWAQHFWHFIGQKYTIKTYYRKYPLQHYFKGRIFKTVVDLILDTDTGLIIIQHSAFNGEQKKWKGKAMELADWFYLSQEALQKIFQKKVIHSYVHFVLAGSMIEIETSSQVINR